MFNHAIFKGKTRYNKNKSTVLILIRKQPGELDWILPVLDKLKENFNIIAIFEKKVALKLLKENEILFSLFKKVVFCYVQSSIAKSIFYRVSNKLVSLLKLKTLSNFFQNKVYENYYDITNLNNQIKKKIYNFDFKKLKLLMQDFTDNSPWVKKFSEKNYKLKIISYPHATHIYGNKEIKIKNKVKFNNSSYLLLSSSSDLFYFKNRFNHSYIIACGFPKYEKSWLKKLESSYRIKKEKKKSIFISFKGYEKEKYNKDKYINQVKSLFDFAKNQKNLILIFKFHPNAQEENVFLSVANKYPKHLWKITKVHQHIAAKNYSFFVSFYNSASALEALACGKVPIELWGIRHEKEQSIYKDLKLCLASKNKLNLYKNLNEILYNKNLNIQKKILNKFNQRYKKNNSINNTNKIILKISKTLT